eukprot:TRINITY_DN12655_c0_g1_i1.p2 TRINITY_DN12655_c0_g1~~TRINITY_DN12655_c0_g1_i1.p2  ORF type:complete len:100 (+),score=9.85 TRINITY_DN12655_c0_g1_i1:27-326(+)
MKRLVEGVFVPCHRRVVPSCLHGLLVSSAHGGCRDSSDWLLSGYSSEKHSVQGCLSFGVQVFSFVGDATNHRHQAPAASGAEIVCHGAAACFVLCSAAS